MAEQPIGRIEYLNRDGTVSSSWEFTKAKELEAVAWRNYDYDISSRIVAYRNHEGKTIPLDLRSTSISSPIRKQTGHK